MITKFNSKTGKNDIIFQGKLISIATNPLENVNKNLYYPATVEFTNQKGDVKQVSAQIFENNLVNKLTGDVRMFIGSTYQCTANQTDDNRTYITISHLSGATYASSDDFTFEPVTKQQLDSVK